MDRLIRTRGYRQFSCTGSLLLAGALCAVPFLSSAAIQLSNVGAGTGGYVVRGQASGGTHRLANVSMGAGDVNGDGIADMILYSHSLGGVGAAAVVFGKANGTPVQMSNVIAGNGGFFIANAGTFYDYASAASAVGDFNGDGLDDVLIGNSRHDSSGFSNNGTVVVVFGKTTGTSVDTNAIAAGGPGGFAITGVDSSDNVGRTVCGAGDVNGDGYDDFVIGSDSYCLQPGMQNLSAVVFGGTHTGTAKITDIGGSVPGFQISTSSPCANVGFDVAGAGDVNGDGLDDVIMNGGICSPIGRAYVIFGKTTSTTVDCNLIESGIGGFPIIETQINDRWAGRMAPAGDVNGDGLADLAVTASGTARGGGPDFDYNYIIFGKSSGTAVMASNIEAGNGGLVVINDQLDTFRNVMRGMGDIDGDGMTDVGIGNVTSGGGYTGKMYVLKGRASGGVFRFSDVLAETIGFPVNGTSPSHLRVGYSLGAAGDVNGDGMADMMVSGTDSYSQGGAIWVVNAAGAPPASSTYVAHHAAGNAPLRGVAEIGDKTQYPPDSRAWIGFTGGTGPGVSNSSSITAKITRSDSSISNLAAPVNMANVMWEITTDRTGWTQAQVALKYTDAEAAGMPESELRIYRASSLSGPWTMIPTTLDMTSNIAEGTTDAMGFFALVGEMLPPAATITAIPAHEEQDYVSWLVQFNEPVGQSFTKEDVSLGGSLPGNALVLNQDPKFIVTLALDNGEANGTASFQLGGVVTDLAGNLLAVPLSAGAHTLVNYPPGDVNKDGTFDIADVALLADVNLGLATLP